MQHLDAERHSWQLLDNKQSPGKKKQNSSLTILKRTVKGKLVTFQPSAHPERFQRCYICSCDSYVPCEWAMGAPCEGLVHNLLMPFVMGSVSWGKSAFHPTGNPKIKPNLRNWITENKILFALCLPICLMALAKILLFLICSLYFSRWIKWKKKRLFWQQKLISSKNCWRNVTEVCGLSRFSNSLPNPLQKLQSFYVVVQRTGYRTVTVVQIWHLASLLQSLHKRMDYSRLSLLQENVTV